MSDSPKSEAAGIVLVGATGLVGATLIARGAGRGAPRLTAIARRAVPVPAGVDLVVVDPADWPRAIAAANAATIVIALGTTWRASGRNEAAFRAVDQELVLASAHAAHEAGTRQCIAVSSVGAAANSAGLYLRVKGEVEETLAGLGFVRLDILRPGLLRGPRAERRPAEKLAMWAAPLADRLLHGGARKYRSIPATTVADAILALAGKAPAGCFIHEHDAISQAAGGVEPTPRR